MFNSFTAFNTPMIEPSLAPSNLEIRVCSNDGLSDVGGLELVAAAVLGVDDLDVRVLGLDLIGEALHAIDAGAAGLVVRDDGHFT